jgi:hypothetical protein
VHFDKSYKGLELVGLSIDKKIFLAAELGNETKLLMTTV